MKQVEEEFLNNFLIAKEYKSLSKGAVLILPCMKQSSSASQKRKKKRLNRTLKHELPNLDKIKIDKHRTKCTFIVIHPPSLASWHLLWAQVWFPVKALPRKERKETGWLQWCSGSEMCPAVSGSPSAWQHLLMDAALWLRVPRLAASGPWQS